MRVELHCHSTCSDGSFPPEQVAAQAGAQGVELFCLTDHDSLAGYEATAAALTGARVLRGVELSCRYANKTVHLLLYGIGEGAGLRALQGRLEGVLEDRRARLKAIIARLRRLGVKLDGEKILVATHGHTPGRPDVARALVEAGVVRSQREAFDRYLHDGGPADVALERVSLAEGLRLGREAGAKMSLAHPHTLRSPQLVDEMFAEYRSAGLEGIEAFYGRYGAHERAQWLNVARRRELVVTGGSDFHGAAVPEVTRPGIELPEPFAERLRAWLGA
jgi:predicted metal-dependent phosphoesterase TrpH